MNKKYKLIESDIDGLFRVKALRDFGDVKKGDVGGYVEHEGSLNHDRKAKIYGFAKVSENAEVLGENAKVSGYVKYTAPREFMEMLKLAAARQLESTR